MKSFKFILAFIVTSTFSFNVSYSQTNFQLGYIVINNSDTLNGLIDYRNWVITPKQIKFKTHPDSAVKIYRPNDIQFFTVEGEIYASGIVTIEDGPFNKSDEENIGQFNNRIDTVFLHVLIKGEKSLYYLKDENQKTHFFIGIAGRYERLLFRTYNGKVNGRTLVKTDEKYKGQLNLYFQDCPAIQKNISSTNYNSYALIKLFKAYNECKQSIIIYQYKVDKIKTEIGLVGGLSLTQIKFAGDEGFNFLKNADYPLSKNVTFGAFCNILFPRQQGKWSLYNELIYFSYQSTGTNLDSSDKNIYTFSTNSVGSSSIKLNNLLRYKYPVKNMFLFVNGGISNGIAISETNYRRIESHVYSESNISEREALINSRRWERGYILGLGGIFKNYSGEFRIGQTNGMSGYILLKSPVQSYYLLFGYSF
jgi:hypothetical protein